MATTSLWKIQNRIDKVISYTTNPEKTENVEMYQALHNTIEYAKADYKTEKQYYVTGINCSAIDSVHGVRIDIWTHLMRGCIINYVH